MITTGGRTRGLRTARIAVGVLAVVSVSACGTSGESGPTTAVGVADTVAIGEMPGPLSGREAPPAPPTTRPTTTVPTIEREPVQVPIGNEVTGNRLLMIGDSVLASVAPRFGGIACDVIPGFGWSIEIAAEPGRYIEFGEAVLDERLAPESGDDWDAAAIMLGNLFDGDLDGYAARLDALLDRLWPRPVLLFTLSEVDDAHAALNEVIRERSDRYDNVVVIDWAELTAAEPEKLLEGDGPDLNDEGSGRLVLFVAAALGDAPDGSVGGCLDPVFTDDTAIVL